MRRPSIKSPCVADRYHGTAHRIAEVSSEVGGCLISARVVNGRLKVEVYRADDTVDVIAPAAGGRDRLEKEARA